MTATPPPHSTPTPNSNQPTNLHQARLSPKPKPPSSNTQLKFAPPIGDALPADVTLQTPHQTSTTNSRRSQAHNICKSTSSSPMRFCTKSQKVLQVTPMFLSNACGPSRFLHQNLEMKRCGWVRCCTTLHRRVRLQRLEWVGRAVDGSGVNGKKSWGRGDERFGKFLLLDLDIYWGLMCCAGCVGGL